MPYPTPIVEIAFDDGPYVVNPTWTDVSSWVRRMNIDRGRSDDWGDFNSIANVVLNNRTRRFDPYFTSGPYYGKLLPRKQIRIRAQTVEGGVTTTHDVFRGFIDGFNPTWSEAGTDSVTTIQCFDALQLLAAEQLPANWALPYIQSLSPRHYWPMDDPIPWYASSNFLLRDLGSTASQLAFQSSTGYPDHPIASGISAGSIGSELQYGAADQTTSSVANVSSNFTLCMWIKNTPSVDCYAEFSGIEARFGYNGAPTAVDYQKFYMQIRNTAGQELGVTTNNKYDNSEPHHFAFTYNATSHTGTMFIDGFQVSQFSGTSSTVPAVPTVEKFRFGLGSFQEVAIFPTILTSTQIRDIVRFSEALYQETSAARFTRIIQQTPFSTSLTSPASAPSSDVLQIGFNNQQASNELRIVGASEGGPLFVSKNGTITMFNQNQIRTQTKSIVSQVTYGAGGTKIGQDVEITTDGDSMRNQAFVNMSGGGVYNQKNTSSVNLYGTSSTSIDTYVQTVEDASALSQITVSWGGYLYPNLTPVDVVLSADGTWKPTLDLELMDRITVNIQPPTGNTISTPMLVQRITHDVVPGKWTTTLDGSARWAAVFIIGTSLLGGTDLLG